MSWQTCHRGYQIIEYDDSTKPWQELRSIGFLEVSHKGVAWSGQLAEGELPARAES